MKRALGYAIAFFALSITLTWLWRNGGWLAHGVLFTEVASRLYELVGMPDVPTHVRQRYVNYVPFILLMALTPRLELGRRLRSIAIGCAVLFATHIALNLAGAILEPGRNSLPVPAALVSDALPFLLWIAFAREFVRDFVERSGPLQPFAVHAADNEADDHP